MVDRDKIQFDLIKLAAGASCACPSRNPVWPWKRSWLRRTLSSGKRENCFAPSKRLWRALNLRRRNIFQVGDDVRSL